MKDTQSEKNTESELSEDFSTEEKSVSHKHKLLVRIVAIIVIIAVIGGIVYLLYPMIRIIGKEGWQDELREMISSHGTIGGLFVYLSIQVVQVIVAVVPSVQAVAGIMYGWFFGGIVSYIGILIGTLTVWCIVKKLGKPIVEAVVSEKHLKKFGFIENESKLIRILIILYVIPGVPKDILNYLVPLTNIKLRDFLLYVLPFRLPAIVLTTAFSSNIARGNYTEAIILSIAMVLIAVFGVLFREKIIAALDKRRNNNNIN